MKLYVDTVKKIDSKNEKLEPTWTKRNHFGIEYD